MIKQPIKTLDLKKKGQSWTEQNKRTIFSQVRFKAIK